MVNTDINFKNLFNGIYQGKTVFVTGHTGFKGSWLTLWLKLLGAKVIGYSLEPPTKINLFDAAHISHEIEHVIADVRDYEKLNKVMNSSKPDIVFHLAAQPIVRKAYDEPRETYETNIMGTVNVLESVRHTSGIRACVVITSDKCYENNEWEYSYRENDAMGGHDPYSSSKGCAELVSASYQRSFFSNKHQPISTGLVSMRSGNVIGGGDWAPDRIIPDCIRALSNNIPIDVRNPSAIRPWQHVLDPLSAYLWIGSLIWQNPDKYNGGWNIGPTVAANMKVKNVVESVIQMWGSGKWKDKSNNISPYESNILRLDCSKAASLLGWEPCYAPEKAIEATVKWYYEYYNKTNFDARSFTITQISNFIKQAENNKLIWIG